MEFDCDAEWKLQRKHLETVFSAQKKSQEVVGQKSSFYLAETSLIVEIRDRFHL